MIKPGLYEQIISRAISRELDAVSEDCKHVEKLDAAEAPQALAVYVAEAVRATLEGMSSGSGEQLAQQVNLVNEILSVLAAKRVDIGERLVDERAELLLQVLR